jgi:hypothetical protein
MWKYTVEPNRPQMTIWCMRLGCWIPKATNTISEYVIIYVFPLKEWLHDRAWMLRSTYIACVVLHYIQYYRNTGSYNILWMCFHTGACPKTQERTLTHPPTEPISLCRFCPVIQVPFALMIKSQTAESHETSTEEFNAHCCQQHVLLYWL